MTRTQSLVVFFSVGILAALGGMLLARSILNNPSVAPQLAYGTVLQPPRPAPAFSLVDQDGAPFDTARLRDRWSLLFFGFTNCGDVCPTTLSVLASVAKSLGDLSLEKRPQVVFVSVDPTRDSPPVIKEYLRHFDPDFVGVTGMQRDVDALTLALGVPSSIRPLENGYAVDHSAAILAFNRRGEFQALFSAPHTTEILAGDYRTLVGAIR